MLRLSKYDCQCSHLPPSSAVIPGRNTAASDNKHLLSAENEITLFSREGVFNIPDVCFSAVPFSTNNFRTHPVGSSCDRLHSRTRETDSLQSFTGTEVTELHIACWISQNICSWKEGNTALPSRKTQGFGVGNSNTSLDSVIQFNISRGFLAREFTFCSFLPLSSGVHKMMNCTHWFASQAFSRKGQSLCKALLTKLGTCHTWEIKRNRKGVSTQLKMSPYYFKAKRQTAL